MLHNNHDINYNQTDTITKIIYICDSGENIAVWSSIVGSEFCEQNKQFAKNWKKKGKNFAIYCICQYYHQYHTQSTRDIYISSYTEQYVLVYFDALLLLNKI